MKAVFTSGKRKKSNIKLSNIKLNFERGEQLIVSSLSDLMRKENLEKLENFSFGDFSMNVGEFGGSYLFNAVISDQKKLRERFSYLNDNQIEKMIKDDEKENYIERHTPSSDHKYNYLYFFDNDQDGLSPNIYKVLKKTNTKKISFFINPSNIFTGDFLEDTYEFKRKNRPRDGKIFKIKDNTLVFCCVPDYENGFCKTKFNKSEIKIFSSNMEYFIKDRLKKKKLAKFKVPNGVYGIYSIINIPFFPAFKNISEISEPRELLGHYIKKFNPKEGTIGHEQEKLERLFKNGTLTKYQFSRARMRSWEGDTLSGEIYSLKRKYKKGTLSKKDFEKEKNKLVLRKLD